jgi:CheY-like chemotaxis protein
MDGWVVLDQLKHDSRTRHVPVQFISALDGERRSLQRGAFGALQKPVTLQAVETAISAMRAYIERRVRRLLVVDDDELSRRGVIELLGSKDLEVSGVATAKDALEQLAEGEFDALLIELAGEGIELLHELQRCAQPIHASIVARVASELTLQDRRELETLAVGTVLKLVESQEELLRETALILHRLESNLPGSKRELLRRFEQAGPIFSGKKALVVDDDLRNVFATTALLEQYEMDVRFAENGQQALAKLDQEPDVALVLMDIMMPEMDGYEATRRIRQQARFAGLPVIALTAKAMPGDREKCIAAGASDYITKPVDSDRLSSLLRVWLNV